MDDHAGHRRVRRGGRQPHRHQPVPRRRLSQHRGAGHLGGRFARGDRDRRGGDHRGGAHPGRGHHRHVLELARGQRLDQRRAQPRAQRRRRPAGGAGQAGPGGAPPAPRHRPASRIQDQPRGPAASCGSGCRAPFRRSCWRTSPVTGSRKSCRPSPASARSAWAARSSATSASGWTGSGWTNAASRCSTSSPRCNGNTSRSRPDASTPRGGRSASALLGEALDLQTLRRIVVREVASSPVYLEDVALVEDGFEDVRRRGWVDGQPAQGLAIRKQRGANAVQVGQDVKQALANIQKTLPPGMELGLNFDSTRFVEESVHEVQFELLLAVLLTAIVCWLFLGSFSSTMNVVLAIPMSLLGTVAVIYFLGYTLNTFTLLAMSLAVGIVVDDAIMVLENIYRHFDSGKDRVRAAREGTHEITFAALAATLAVVAIFIPVVFMKGVTGKFFLQFGVTLCVAVLLSYLEAITLAPARSAQILRPGHQNRNVVGRLADRAFATLARGYAAVLARGLRRPGLVLLGAAGLLVAAGFALRGMPSEFVPSQDQSRLNVRMQTAVGSDLEETDSHPQARRGVRPEPARGAPPLHGRRQLPGQQRQRGHDDDHAQAARPADEPGRVHGRAAQGAQLLPWPAGGGAGSVAERVHRRARLPGRAVGARARLGQAGRGPGRAARQAHAHRDGGRSRHRLPGRHARAAHQPRPGSHRRPGRLGRGGGHHHQRPGGRLAGRQIQQQRPPRGRAAALAGRATHPARGPGPAQGPLAHGRADPAVGADHPSRNGRPCRR